MKKYLKSLFVAIIIGLFLSNLFLKQYDSYSGIKVSSMSDMLYFIQYGVYSNINSMEENTINLQNYVYNIDDDKYYVYVGITSLDENKDKIVKYYSDLGYTTIVKTYEINNKKFLEKVKIYDEVLKDTTDITTISGIISQMLETYEEVVINGDKN